MASMVRVTADGFAALVSVARGDDPGGEAEALAGELGPALDAVVAPRAVIDLERRGEHGTCWVGSDAACLLVPEQPGWFRAFSFAPGELPVALLRAVGAAEAPRPAGEAIRFEPAELADALARSRRGDRVAAPLDGFRAHWRASADGAAVEVIETDSGSWAVVPEGAEVVLHPVDATWVYAAVADLVHREGAHA